ncbi:MAG: Trm112 family protein [Gemmatimonadota bacterium]|nr:Trm112 family protein [Gemmatimonadota bacterium]
MNVLLTDILVCPRCGTDFGLILLSHETAQRRVREGELGCPNCRDRFPIRDGFGDLRAPPRHALEEETLPSLPPRAGLAAAAGLGVAEGPGVFVFLGGVGRVAGEVARAVSGIEVAAVSAAAAGWPAEPGVSRMVSRPGIPIRSGRVRGVAMDAYLWGRWGEEALRVLVPRSRLVLFGSPQEGTPWKGHEGVRVLLEDESVTVLTSG